MYKPMTGRQNSMGLEETSPFPLAFPPEIWRIVLHSFGTQPQDLVELWIGCRGVSRHFKHEVEELFIANYLPRTSLRFDITTSQGFNRNSRIEFHDHQVQTVYNRTSVDRTGAFFKARNDYEAKLLKQMHDGGSFSGPSHLVDLSRPSDDLALPGVFFHVNGDVEVGWRELFAAVLAEEKYYYRTGLIPVNSRVSQLLPREAFVNDWTQVIEEHTSRTVTRRGMGASIVEQGFREAEIFESNMSKVTQAEGPRARVFHMVIIRLWDRTQTHPRSLIP